MSSNLPPQSSPPAQSSTDSLADDGDSDHARPPPPRYSTIQNDAVCDVLAVPPADGARSVVAQQQADGPGDQPPPAYTSDQYGSLDVFEGGMNTQAQLSADGRINININQKSARLSALLSPALRQQWSAIAAERDLAREPSAYLPPELAADTPPLNILIQIIGSRGDVQPFVALGKVLRERYRHRVRVATHPTFRPLVEDHGLEFFSLGGDPSELMAFMVKNPGLVPGMASLRAGDVTRRRKDMWDMLLGAWRACIEPGDGSGYQPALDRAARGPLGRPFIADAIIANPPSFAHIHCAERLGIPLHLMFTMPWSPTAAFPHPLANIQSSDVEPNLTNFLSYVLVDMMTWQGLGDLVNKFREKTLGLEAVSMVWAPGTISRLKVPHTYCWSPTLIPKPDDWGSQLAVSGFFFLSLASSYTPPPELERFLSAGPPPVYIGFGSIVVADPNALTVKILEAVRLAGCRALVSKGWGGLGADDLDLPDSVMLLGNCPHDWLFPRCAAVVHHGGAGTTAAGINCGKATVVVPFFGDQLFWGKMVSKAGAGPDPIPIAKLTAENLAAAILQVLGRQMQAKAEVMGDSIRSETGTLNGARSFLSSVEQMGLGRCDILTDRVAVWGVRGTDIKLSALAASALVDAQLIDGGYAALKLWRHREWEVNHGPLEPITGGAGALMGTIGSIVMGVGDFPKDMLKLAKGGGGAGAGGKGKAVEGHIGPLQENRSAESIATTTTKSSTSTAAMPGSFLDEKEVVGEKAVDGASPVVDKGKGKEKDKDNIGFEISEAISGTKSVSKIVGAGLRSPMDFTLGIAQGFRNAPKLYGDEIRPETRVTGFHSGLKAAGKEFSLGIYDGFTGLVTQPVKGAKEDGLPGAIKGVGKGIGGLVLKSGAGIWGIPGYAMKGVHREFLKLGSRSKDLTGYIETSRAVQGVHDLGENEDLRPYVIQRWSEIKSLTPKAQAGGWQTRMRARRHSGGSEDVRRRKADAMVDMRTYVDDQSLDDNVALHWVTRASTMSPSSPASAQSAGAPALLHGLGSPSSEKKLPVVAPPPTAGGSASGAGGGDSLRRPPMSRHDGYGGEIDDPELEEAIRLSMMEASLPRSRSFDVLRRKPVPPPRQPERATTSITASRTATTADGIYDGELMRRIEGLSHTSSSAAVSSLPPPNYSNSDSEPDDEFDDADLRRAIEESRLDHQHLQQRAPSPSPPPPSPPLLSRLTPPRTQAQDTGVADDDAELARALQESLRLEEENRRKREEEERIVLEYVARFSREEAEREREREMRNQLPGGGHVE